MPWNQNSFFTILIVSGGTGSGVFVYSPKPGAGNLIASVAAQAGTDPYGNAYKAGITSYSKVAPFPLVELFNGQVLFSGAGTFQEGSVTDAGQGSLTLQSSRTAAGDVQTGLVLLSSLESNDGLNPEIVAKARIQLQDAVGNPSYVVPVSPATPNVDESAQAFVFANLWVAAGRETPQYFLCAAPAIGGKNSVHVAGSVQVPLGGWVNGQAVTTAIPAAYRPAHTTSIIGMDITSGAVVRFTLGANGVVQSNQIMSGAVANGDLIDMQPTVIALNN